MVKKQEEIELVDIWEALVKLTKALGKITTKLKKIIDSEK